MLAGFPADQLKKWLVPGAIAVAITAVVIALLWRSNNQYTTLFGSQENIPVAQVVEVLAGEGLGYRVEPNSGNLLVRESDLPKARMALAAKGISAQTPKGYELMDKEEMLGSSQFIQNVRFKRSLEGELAQSIMALDSVDFARVHLGISEASSFVLSNKPDSSASVVVRLKYGKTLSDEQVAAIVNLVAGSVPGMKPAQVRVVDQHGALLSANIEELLSGRSGIKNSSEMIQRLRNEIEHNLAHILTPVIGAENFRISVVPRINFSQVEETQERYLGDPRVSSESLQQENTTDQLAIGIPGSLSNRPVATTPPAENSNPQALSTRNQAQRQFQFDRDVRHVRYPGYQLEKLSVAVVLNESAKAVQGWSEANHLAMNQLLANAAGIDTRRGDELTLTQLSFTRPEVAEVAELQWWERDSTLLWAERGGIGLLALLVILFGLLPMMRRVGQTPAHPKPASPALPDGVFVRDDGEKESELSPVLAAGNLPGDDHLPPQGSGLETKVSYLQTLAHSETDRVAEVLKQWIGSNELSNSSGK
ncbi:flagellar M-ring protein FliF [Pantoea sp. B65]